MPLKDKAALKAELPKLHKTKLGILGLVIWGVHSRFHEQQPDPLKKGNRTNKLKTSSELVSEVANFFTEEIARPSYKKIKLERPLPDAKGNVDGRDTDLVLQFIEYKGGHKVTEKAFNNLRTHFENELVHNDPDSLISIEIPREHLELLCLYGSGLTYEQLLELPNPVMAWRGRIRYIHANMDRLFGPILQHFVGVLEEVDRHCDSPDIKKWVCGMIDRETAHIKEGLEKGYYPVHHSCYFQELIKLMEQCTNGFGVNISKWNKHWNETSGAQILSVNEKQKLGLLKKGAFRYIRIFLVDGEGEDLLSEEEEKIILAQKQHEVNVYVVAKEAWKEFADQIDDFDFAVLRVDDSPMLLRSRFDEGKTSGIFYTHRQQPKKEYEASLHKLLTDDKGKYIYNVPDQANGKIDLGSPIGASGVNELRNRLLLVCIDKKILS